VGPEGVGAGCRDGIHVFTMRSRSPAEVWQSCERGGHVDRTCVPAIVPQTGKALLFNALKGWLPFVDDYRTKCIVPRPSFRLRLEQVMRLGLAA
jgi:hypothetical protein